MPAPPLVLRLTFRFLCLQAQGDACVLGNYAIVRGSLADSLTYLFESMHTQGAALSGHSAKHVLTKPLQAKGVMYREGSVVLFVCLTVL